MNLIEIKNQLVEIFVTKGVFSVADFIKIKLPDELKDVRESIIREALIDLEGVKFIRGATKDCSATEPVNSVWVLEAPIGYDGQKVAISMATAVLISKIVNTYCEANKIDGEFCNVQNITETDINNLCAITMSAINKDEN